MAKYKENAAVLSQERLSDGIYSMWIETADIAGQAVPGQFISVYSKDGSRMLPRPISICETDREKNKIRIVYRVAGKGTAEFSGHKAGDRIDILGPLGNGFPADNDGYMLAIGGGIGVPPMLEVIKEYKGRKTAVLGYRDSNLFLKDEFDKYSDVVIATEDGSIGTKGNVLDAIKENGLKPDIIYACGPTPMLKAVKKYAMENGIRAWISLEEKMACGIGACLACVCRSKEIDEHSQVNNKRICREGPVFSADEVEL